MKVFTQEDLERELAACESILDSLGFVLSFAYAVGRDAGRAERGTEKRKPSDHDVKALAMLRDAHFKDCARRGEELQATALAPKKGKHGPN